MSTIVCRTACDREIEIEPVICYSLRAAKNNRSDFDVSDIDIYICTYQYIYIHILIHIYYIYIYISTYVCVY